MKKILLVKRIACAFVCIATAACGILDDDGQKKVKYVLKDSSSAEFRNMKKAVKPARGNADVFCGEVNSKNSYGSLTGYKKYVVEGRLVLIEGESEAFYDFAESSDDRDILVRDSGMLASKMKFLYLQKKAENDSLEQARNGQTGVVITAFDLAWGENCR